MKLGSIKYLIKEGFRGTWANRLMSLASVGVLVACMVIIGLAILIAENVSVAIGTLEKQNVVMVYMEDYNWALYSDAVELNAEREGADERGVHTDDYIIHSEDEAKELCKEIEKLDNVVSAEFISSEDGLDIVTENMLDGQEEYFSFLNDEYGNPMSMAAKVTMNDMALFESTVEQIEGLNGVDQVRSQADVAKMINAIKQGVYVAGIWIIAILVIISLVIVSNTIRVTMYNRKLEISIMKAVGATDTFVRIPFVIEGVIIGIISAFISEGLLFFCYKVATENILSAFTSSGIIEFKDVALYLLLIFIGIGVLSGILGSFIMIRKYLKHEGSEFSAI